MAKENPMTLVDHLGELRGRIVKIMAVLVISLIGGLFAADPILKYLKHTKPANTVSWHAFSPWDAIGIYMKFAFIIALVVTLPFILYQLWSFVKPGLREEEQKATVKYIPGAVLLFLIGLSFAYFIVFPMAFYFTSKVTKSLDLTETYGIAQYFTFMFNILLPMSVLFELPVVVMFLTKLRILNPLRLRKLRRISYFVLYVIATVVTPPDFISDWLVFVPLLILYEFSVFMSSRVYKQQQESDRQYEARFSEQ